MAKWLITLGIICIALGVLWPLLAKIGLGRLPGDFSWRKGNSQFHFPLTSSILLSLLLTLLLWIFRR